MFVSLLIFFKFNNIRMLFSRVWKQGFNNQASFLLILTQTVNESKETKKLALFRSA